MANILIAVLVISISGTGIFGITYAQQSATGNLVDSTTALLAQISLFVGAAREG